MPDPTEEREAGAARSQSVVHTVAQTAGALTRILAPALERVDITVAATQLIVLTADTESTITVSETVFRLTGPQGIEVLPVTAANRAARLLQQRPIHAVAGTALEIQTLIERSVLKLDAIRTIVLAWVPLAGPEAGASSSAVEAIMSELPKSADRILITRETNAESDQFVERYMRRARRAGTEAAAEERGAAPATLAMRYVIVSSASRGAALARLLDELDPPSASVVVTSEQSEEEASQAVRQLGYRRATDPVQVTRGAIPVSINTVMLFDAPSSSEDLALVAAAQPVEIIALVRPRELEALRSLTVGALTPFTSTAPANTARQRDRLTRDELQGMLLGGVASREILALEPLLDQYDGVEIAAAALRLLDRERSRAQAAAASQRPAASSGAAAPREARTGAGAAGGARSGMQNVFMTVGSRDGATQSSVIAALTGTAAISSAQIGRVDIRDTHSLVEVDAAALPQVVERMNGASVSGRRIVARPERDRAERERPDRGGERGGGGDRGGSSDRPRRDGAGAPRRDAPRRDFTRGPKREFSDRPRRDFGDRPKRDLGDRPRRDAADRRPPRDGGRGARGAGGTRPPRRDH